MISGMRTAVAFRKLQRFLGMRALGSKVTLNVRARTCAEIMFVWPRMDFRCAGRSAGMGPFLCALDNDLATCMVRAARGRLSGFHVACLLTHSM